MKISGCILIIIILFAVTSCTPDTDNKKMQGYKKFKSTAYGFSFSFPANWQEVTKDLPNLWAIKKDSDSTILTVNRASLKDLRKLGEAQAVRDMLQNDDMHEASKEEVEKITGMVKITEMGRNEWYSYAIEFPDKNVRSVISGIICSDMEINIVLVSSLINYHENLIIYEKILKSFSC